MSQTRKTSNYGSGREEKVADPIIFPSHGPSLQHFSETFLGRAGVSCSLVPFERAFPRVFRFAFASEFLNLGNPGGVQPILVACCWLSCLTSRSHLAQGTGQDPATAILC